MQMIHELEMISSAENIGRIPSSVLSCPDPYTATEAAHAVVVCTEWDEFIDLDYKKIYKRMSKPAFLFDGRKILNHEELISIGFHVETVGKRLIRKNVERKWN